MGNAIVNSYTGTIKDLGAGVYASAPAGPIGQAQRPWATSKTTTSLNIEFSKGDNGITSVAQYRDASEAPQRFGVWSSDITGNQEDVTITGLNANTMYEVRVKSTYGEQEGDWSPALRVRTHASGTQAFDIEGIPYPTIANATLTTNAGFAALTVDPFLEPSPSDPHEWPGSEAANVYYIDNTDAAATDTDNTWGYPDKPRVTLPSFQNLPAGTQIHINAGTYTIPNQNTRLFSGTNGTDSSSGYVWVRGRSKKSMPVINGRAFVLEGASHIFFENLKWNGNNDINALFRFGYDGQRGDTDHIVIRSCEMTNIDYKGGGGGIISITSRTENDQQTNTVFVYDCYMHENHQNLWTSRDSATGRVSWDSQDADHHSIGITAGYVNLTQTGNVTKLIWAIDNIMTEHSGNAVQMISIGDPVTDWRDRVKYIFIGGNRTGNGRQGGLWSKRASHVIFADNEVDYAGDWVGGNGQLCGTQYGADFLWFINNRLNDGKYGFQRTDTTETSTIGRCFLLGNVITELYNIATNAGSFRGGTAISMTSNQNLEVYALNNTGYNIICGCEMSDFSGNTQIDLNNNIFVVRDYDGSDPPEDDIEMLFINDGGNNTARGDENIWQILSGTETWAYNGSDYSTLSAFETASGTNFTNGSIADPLFEDAVNGDFRLASGSPALTTPNLTTADGTEPYTEFNTEYGISLTAPTYIGAKPSS